MWAAGNPALPAGESHAAASPGGRKEVSPKVVVSLLHLFSSVSDPRSFDTDPDQAFWAEYRSGSGSRVFVIITKK